MVVCIARRKNVRGQIHKPSVTMMLGWIAFCRLGPWYWNLGARQHRKVRQLRISKFRESNVIAKVTPSPSPPRTRNNSREYELRHSRFRGRAECLARAVGAE